MALKRVNQPQKLALAPPGPDAMRIQKPADDVVSLRPVPRVSAGCPFNPRVSAETAAYLMTIRKVR